MKTQAGWRVGGYWRSKDTGLDCVLRTSAYMLAVLVVSEVVDAINTHHHEGCNGAAIHGRGPHTCSP